MAAVTAAASSSAAARSSHRFDLSLSSSSHFLALRPRVHPPSHPSLLLRPLTSSQTITHRPRSIPTFASSSPVTLSSKVFHGECFVLPDNIDTDQIIPAEHLTLVPSKPDEYEKLGSFAMAGLPSVHGRFIEEGKMKTKYAIIVAGSNFGCGSSREHAPVALGASGVKAVVAESYARIFFRNSVATGELYPLESEGSISDQCKTGDVVTVDLEQSILINHTQNKQFILKPLGDAGPVIDAGGLFAYARKTGMIAS